MFKSGTNITLEDILYDPFWYSLSIDGLNKTIRNVNSEAVIWDKLALNASYSSTWS